MLAKRLPAKGSTEVTARTMPETERCSCTVGGNADERSDLYVAHRARFQRRGEFAVFHAADTGVAQHADLDVVGRRIFWMFIAG